MGEEREKKRGRKIKNFSQPPEKSGANPGILISYREFCAFFCILQRKMAPVPSETGRKLFPFSL